MALQAVIYHDGYTVHEDIYCMDEETISKSMERFNHYKLAGVITSGEYYDTQWNMTSEVIKNATLNFQIDEAHFARFVGPKLNCTLSQYKQAMRIVITSRLGYSIATLKTNLAIMRDFANALQIPKQYFYAQLLADLLYLLPGESVFKMSVMEKIDDISPLDHENKQQRRLAHYQSYLTFSDVLQKFWTEATETERVFYFPVWYWYTITGVLPLRPTECVLTPRDCIRKENGKYYLTVRRSRLKGKRQSSGYSIDTDYDKKEYPITELLAKNTLEYIAATKNMYESDIDVLFCKSSQFLGTMPTCENNHHYTYSNLHQCLLFYYRDIIEKKYGYKIVPDHDVLLEKEIEKLNLGDTRHIAMISIALSGGSPAICKELAGHDSIANSAHYYTNLTTFLDVLGYERYREIKSAMPKAFGASISTQYPVGQGYCQCENVWCGDYSSCASAVDADGMPGSCIVCKWYVPRGGSLTIKLPESCNIQTNVDTPQKKISMELRETCTLLRQTIDQLRHGLGNTDTVSCILDRLAAQSRQYIQASAVDRLMQEREEI